MKRIVFLIFIPLILHSCTSDIPEIKKTNNEQEKISSAEKDRTYKTREDISLTDWESKISEIQQYFSFAFFDTYEKHLQEEGAKTNNVLVSPFCLHITLSMLANGLSDEKANEYINRFQNESISMEQINKYNKHIADELNDLDNFTDILISNSFWTVPNYVVNKEYGKLIRHWYDAEILNADLFSWEGVNKINKWVEEKSFGLIPQFYNTPPCSPITLVNTLYFKGCWTSGSFSQTETTFNNIDGSSVKQPFFTQVTLTDAYMNDDFSVVSLEYGNRAFRLNFILPSETEEMSNIGNITPEKWKNIRNNLSLSRVEFIIPKFDIEIKDNIFNVLSEMGLSELFTGVNLTNISSDFEGFNEVLHSTKLRIDEKGSEGAAVVGLGWITNGGSENTTPEMVFKADRPFMFILDEVSTGTILFMGRINKL